MAVRGRPWMKRYHRPCIELQVAGSRPSKNGNSFELRREDTGAAPSLVFWQKNLDLYTESDHECQ